MKKNTMMRVASALLVAVLLTTCAISGTFAKYISSADAEDSARVAKWGVTVAATAESFAEKYEDAADAAGTKVVSNVSGQDVLAPGTEGQLCNISISGTTEVMVDIEVTANLELANWIVDGNVYCPIVFTVGTEEIKMGGTIADLDDLEDAVVAKIAALAETGVAANETLDRNIIVSWAWDFDDNGNGTNDGKDTALAQLTTLPTINFECEVVVKQVD